ncbi:MAG: hypothetical protein KDK44_04080 [Chlamydiia bacterium]|nr:hypothetical protein [Chlamydiia bacterium]
MGIRPVVFLFLVLSCCLLSSNSLADKLTLITSTSVIPSHPSTQMLEITQKSLNLIPEFKDCPRIIVFDGIPSHQMNRSTAYEAYKQNVIELAKTNTDFANTKLIFCKEHKHLALALKEAMAQVTTPFVFVHQHDFKIIKPIDAIGLIRSMEDNPNLKHVRLNRRQVMATKWDGKVDNVIEGPSYVPLSRTWGWSDNDHFCPKKYYDEFIFSKIKRKKPMEKVIQPLQRRAERRNRANHKIFGTYIYGNLGDSPIIAHLDGKRWRDKPHLKTTKNKS